MRKLRNPCSSALLKWEDAGHKLSAALSAYLQSCTLLDTFSVPQYANSNDMVPRIDYSLSTLHTKLSEELSQSRTILARMRNKVASRGHLLPKEVLAEIFMDVVYTPGPDDYQPPSMKDNIKRIYGHLYSLLGVCSSWRNIGIALAELWSIIPLSEGEVYHFPAKATTLALQ